MAICFLIRSLPAILALDGSLESRSLVCVVHYFRPQAGAAKGVAPNTRIEPMLSLSAVAAASYTGPLAAQPVRSVLRMAVSEPRRGAEGRPFAEKSKVAPMFDAPDELRGFVGEEDGFDPLGFSKTFDMKYLREAEIKHARICMLSFLGFVFPDIGLKLVGTTVPSINALAKPDPIHANWAWIIFIVIAVLEITAGIPSINYTMNGGDREPGDFGFDPIGFLDGATPAEKETMQLKELKNGRLAMIALGGIITQAGLGGSHVYFPYI